MVRDVCCHPADGRCYSRLLSAGTVSEPPVTSPIDVPDVLIEEPERRSIVRHPSDALRLVLAIAVTLFGLLLATTLNELSEAITVEVVEGFDGLADPVVVVFILGMSIIAIFIPLNHSHKHVGDRIAVMVQLNRAGGRVEFQTT